MFDGLAGCCFAMRVNGFIYELGVLLELEPAESVASALVDGALHRGTNNRDHWLVVLPFWARMGQLCLPPGDFEARATDGTSKTMSYA